MANINQNRWDQLVRRVAGLIGPGSKVNNTIGDLFPMLDVENLPGELYLLAGTRLATGGAVQVGAAGESARVQLFNPADSGVICTLTTAIVASPGPNNVRYVLTPNAASTLTTSAQARDTRLGIITTPTCEVRTESSVTILAGNGEFRILGNAFNQLTDPNGIAVLGPGTGIIFNTVVLAQTLSVAFFWREREAEASELLF